MSSEKSSSNTAWPVPVVTWMAITTVLIDGQDSILAAADQVVEEIAQAGR